ncbi:MAG: 1-acyl-sn-glycerol-3-phosphate acyltransferase [Saprospiraceae bacterium]|nr:1-acyl-sn-glycerol-3-phosphate acyltransferase [Saprospiraceae bacterium]
MSDNHTHPIITKEKDQIYPPLIEDIREWPINKLTENRSAFVRELENYSYETLRRKSSAFLKDLIQKTVFQEKTRIKMEPWRIDPPNDRIFWNRVRKKISETDLDSNAQKEKNIDESLKMIIHRYAEEIVGSFNIRTYRLIRKLLTVLFKRLLNKGIKVPSSNKADKVLLDKLKIYGPIEKIRTLATKGTVVILPTHSSNLDSVLIGYTMDYKLGIPGPAYGAGLNLYNYGPAAYFMNRLGAYRVDRRKKSVIYLTTLAGMSKLSIQKGTHSLFFPGGTRSRSGHLEDRLKLGLLNSVIESQRAIYEEGREDKVYVVPLVLSYHFVLEAKNLIEDFLKKTGKERYVKSRNEFTSFRSWTKFLYQFISKSSTITLSFGEPMDCFGNFLNNDGESIDQKGTIIDTRDYFILEGKLTANHQRESEYTKNLGNLVAQRYKAENIILSSHLVSFVAFQSLKNANPDMDLYSLLTLPEDEYFFSRENFVKQAELVIEFLKIKASEGSLKLPEIFEKDILSVILDGIEQTGTFHSQRPITTHKKGDFYSQDFRLLYFYNNRLESYNFTSDIDWTSIPVVYQID